MPQVHQDEVVKKLVASLDENTKQKILEAAVREKLKKLPATHEHEKAKASDLDAEWG